MRVVWGVALCWALTLSSGAGAAVNGRLAFSVKHQNAWSDIYTVNPDGSDVRALTANGGTASDRDARWSPDGLRIAYTHVSGDRSSVWTMDADGSNKTLVVPDGGSPDWSPDGTRLVYVANSFYSHNDFDGIAVVGADGTKAHVIVPARIDRTTFESLGDPAWSPDARTIAYEDSGLSGQTPRASVWLVDVSGAGRRLLVADAAWPRWSPDGARLSVAKGQLPYVVNADGSGLRQAAGSPSPTAYYTWGPSVWSPDGTLLFNTALLIDVTVGRTLTWFTPIPKLQQRFFPDGVLAEGWQPLPAGTPPAPRPPYAANGRLCTLWGESGADRLRAYTADSVLCGLGGNDSLSVAPASAFSNRTKCGCVFDGGAGNDTIDARNGASDIVIGGFGFDTARIDKNLDVVTGVEKLLP